MNYFQHFSFHVPSDCVAGSIEWAISLLAFCSMAVVEFWILNLWLHPLKAAYYLIISAACAVILVPVG